LQIKSKFGQVEWILLVIILLPIEFMLLPREGTDSCFGRVCNRPERSFRRGSL